MESFKTGLESIRSRIGEVSPVVRLLLGSFCVIALMTLFLVGQYAGKSDMVRLPVASASLPAIQTYLEDNGISHDSTTRPGSILVPVEQRQPILLAVTEQGLIETNSIDFVSLVQQDTPFQSHQQTKMRRLAATMSVLESMISQMSGVQRARVIIADPQRPAGIGSSFTPPTAAVTVAMQTGSMGQDLVDSVAGLVAGSVPGLKIDDVIVTDARTNKRRRARSGDDMVSSTNLEQQTRTEDVIRRRIEEHLSYIPGVMVAVHAQVVTKDVSKRSQSYSEPVIAPVSERSSAAERVDQMPGGEPGVRGNLQANAPLSLRMAGVNGTSTVTEQNEARLDSQFPSETSLVHDPTGYATKINASINVPRSYLVMLYRQSISDSSAQPTDEQLSPLVEQSLGQIKSSVTPLIDTDTVDDARPGVVSVMMIHDLASLADTLTMPELVPSGGTMVADQSPLGGGTVKYVGLGTLAAVSLFTMLFMVRRAFGGSPAPPSDEAAVGMHMYAGMDTPLVGEADEAPPVLSGMELASEDVRHREIIGQINQMARNRPEQASVLLGKWIRNAG